MVLDLLLAALVSVVVIATGVYIGVLRALDVYANSSASFFLMDRPDPPVFRTGDPANDRGPTDGDAGSDEE
ncbi:hypothetical protein [Halobaculum limi]|uniref:hypothetical protein n=1 Tax=Halobaculum limi TaxID=3031916 RepID=UPI002406B06A|nr:hypothetical protein [Halobaculum sp. YSMS11]